MKLFVDYGIPVIIAVGILVVGEFFLWPVSNALVEVAYIQ